MQEPLEAYSEVFERYQAVIEDLIESTVDLSKLQANPAQVVADQQFQEVLRYLTGPPISADDLKVLAEASLSGRRLSTDPDMVQRILDVILAGLDRRRFPWVTENREASAAEREAAVLATAALIAASRTGTKRRNEGKFEQEQIVEHALRGLGFALVARRPVHTIHDAPRPGEFCGESALGTRKADFLVGLYDGRLMPIECKVSNSSTNSIKRLNNDAAVKATSWITDFGRNNVVPTAVLSGVYKLRNLVDAQHRGLTVFWAHDLTAFTDWISATRQ